MEHLYKTKIAGAILDHLTQSWTMHHHNDWLVR